MTSRSTAQRRRRNRRLARSAAPMVGLLAAGLMVWQGSAAAFTASTNNTDDAWATGSLQLDNDGGSAGAAYGASTSALFNETLIKPGSQGAKCITVRSSGNLPGELRLSRGALSGTNEANLAAALDITIDAVAATTVEPNVTADCTGYTGLDTGAIFDGTLATMPTDYASSTASGTLTGSATQYVTYRIGWSMSASVTDNSLQGSDVETDLIWEVQ